MPVPDDSDTAPNQASSTGGSSSSDSNEATPQPEAASTSSEEARGSAGENAERIKRGTRDYVRYTQLGLQIAATVGLSALAGYALDTWLQTAKPWFTLTLSLLGIAGAMLSIIRLFRDGE